VGKWGKNMLVSFIAIFLVIFITVFLKVFEELGEEIKDKRMIENENIKIHLISEMH
jgi:hypothetical protein